jgi:hypothetical protein
LYGSARLWDEVQQKHSLTHQLATPPFVIHIFWPFMMYSSPFFSALVFIPFTSDPAPGSVTAYACNKSFNPLKFCTLQVSQVICKYSNSCVKSFWETTRLNVKVRYGSKIGICSETVTVLTSTICLALLLVRQPHNNKDSKSIF